MKERSWRLSRVPEVLGSVLGSLVQHRTSYTEESPKKGHEYNNWTGASLLLGKAERAGTSYLREGVYLRRILSMCMNT